MTGLLSRALNEAAGILADAADWCEKASEGRVRMHIGPLYVWTLPALERYAQAIHASGVRGDPAPSYTGRKSEAESALPPVRALRSVN